MIYLVITEGIEVLYLKSCRTEMILHVLQDLISMKHKNVYCKFQYEGCVSVYQSKRLLSEVL